MAQQQPVKKLKSSWYLPEDVLRALRLVKEKERIDVSGQIEIGAREYLKRHDKMLKREGIDLWK